MQALRDIMLSLIALAALSAATDAFGGDEGETGGLRLMTGMCAAGCILNACGRLMRSLF